MVTSSSPYTPHYNLYPRQYNAIRYPATSPPFIIDGNISKAAWANIPFSDPFGDIIGNNSSNSYPPPSTCTTRFKLLWDDHYLYIAFLLESYNRTVHTSFTERNSPIFQQDSDIEVFLDPLGCCHNYKEVELNAYNTIWNLMLDKPYDDNGSEHSGRIAKPGDDKYYDTNDQQTAVELLEGDWNDPKGAVWSVEMALSHADTLAHYSQQMKDRTKPQVGMRWRINFSRVEEKGTINWTWAPQIIWDPEAKTFQGKIAMHLPDVWGYLNFVNEDGSSYDKDLINERRRLLSTSGENLDPTWPARLAAMNLYYAQRLYKSKHGHYSDNLQEVRKFCSEEIITPFGIDISVKEMMTTKKGKVVPKSYVITVQQEDGSIVVTVTDERFLEVVDLHGD